MLKTLGSEWRQYEEAFPKLQQSKVDIISLECQNSRVPMDLIEPLAREVARGKLNALSAGAEIIRKELSASYAASA